MSISKIASAARLIFGILVHKACVGCFCFQAGLYWRGLVHDLSKFHPVEFIEGVKFCKSSRSQTAEAKEQNGWSSAWLHHKGMNRHHREYWVDGIDQDAVLVRMPFEDALELVCNGLGASVASRWKIRGLYQNEWNRWTKGPMKQARMHPQTRTFIHMMLRTMKEEDSCRILLPPVAKWTYEEAMSRCKDVPASCPIADCVWKEPDNPVDKAFWEC